MIVGKEGAVRRGLSRCVRWSGLLAVLGVLWVVPATASAAGTPAFSNRAPWRHGAVPTRAAWAAAKAAGKLSANDMNYQGGIAGVGVTTGAPRVYLVFWGSQWGTQGTNSSGYFTYSNDPVGFAPRVQAFLSGLGTGNETWSGVMTQYCQGVPVGTQLCPASNTQHVGYPTGGALAGVWEDASAASPAASTAHQLAQEAENAATHFGNTTTASNRNIQYVIVSPHGANPDQYKTSGFCAWHDYSGDTSMDGGGAVGGPTLAFTNLPYLTDVGASCGANFVNSGSAGTLDGVSIVEGHEYAETITDQFPAGGWIDATTAENGDKCAWISSGQGKSQNISLTTGTFAVQSTWANDFNSGAGGCEVSHPIVTNPSGNTVTVTNPGSQTSTVGTAVSLQIHASDSASGQTLTYSATGLPAGLSINSSTGLISGTPTTPQTVSVTVKATDTTSASGSASFTWTVNSTGGCTSRQLLGNPGFESGTASPWSGSAGVIEPASAGEAPHSGNYAAWLGFGTTKEATIAQTVTVPTGCSNYTFSYWLHIDTADTGTTASSSMRIVVRNTSGTLLQVLGSYSNLNAAAGYQQYSVSLSAYAGKTIVLRFGSEQFSTKRTNFVVDDTAFNVS